MKITSYTKYVDLFVWIAVYFILLFAILIPTISFSGGIVYPLDDVYIHLTMAKNLLQNGSWGLSPNENIAASSSPLYTLILSPFTVSNYSAILTPLFVNIVASLLLLYLFHSMLQKIKATLMLRIFIGIIFLLLVPLPSLTMMGMEHLLHCVLVVSMVFVLTNETKNQWILPILAALSLFLRLETSFVLFGIGIWCLFEKNWDILFQISIGFVLGFGLYFLLSIIFSVSIIPNTILLKTIITNEPLFQTILHKIWNSKLLLFLTVLSLVATIVRWKDSKVFLIVFITSILQLVLARQGWFYRYETFVIVLFMVVLLYEFFSTELQRKKFATILITTLFLLICSKRAFLSMTTTHIASKNIYDQQIQMAMIVKTLPVTTKIAVNDIGAVSFYNDNKFVDLYGIATKEVFQLKQNKSFTSQNLRNHLKQEKIDLAMVYTSWFDATIFDDYTRIRTLNLTNNVVCGDTVVTFFEKRNSVHSLPHCFP